MSTPTSRPKPPEVEFRFPDCPFCMGELNGDGDSLWCDTCDATWNKDGQDGEWYDSNAPQCDAVDGRFLPGGQFRDLAMAKGWAVANAVCRCIRTTGHKGNHSSDGRDEWPSEQSATAEQLAEVSS